MPWFLVLCEILPVTEKFPMEMYMAVWLSTKLHLLKFCPYGENYAQKKITVSVTS